MEENIVVGYFGHAGKFFAALYGISFMLFVGIALFAEPRNPFWTVYACIIIFGKNFLISVYWAVKDALYEKKIDDFVEEGRRHEPVKTAYIPKGWARKTYDGKAHHYFKIECFFKNEHGENTSVKSRALAVRRGTRLVSIPTDVIYDAMVYSNPNRPGDYVVHVRLE